MENQGNEFELTEKLQMLLLIALYQEFQEEVLKYVSPNPVVSEARPDFSFPIFMEWLKRKAGTKP